MSRTIPLPTRCILWGRSAGRCEFQGCNRDVTRHPETKETVNLSEVSHIIGFSKDGPRGEKELSKELSKDIDNLMLLCTLCHDTIDKNKEKYPIELLREMKEEHEDRVSLSTHDIPRSSHILLYGARVGEHKHPLSFKQAAPALRPKWHPAEKTAIQLGMMNDSERQTDPDYWINQKKHLERLVESRIKARIDAGELEHLSIFGLAPQPLLILLGYLLSDIVPAEVYQRRREPATWKWEFDKEEKFTYLLDRPEVPSGTPALILGTTNPVHDERVLEALPGASIWRLSIKNTHNDFLKYRSQLQSFRETIRPLMDEIIDTHGRNTQIHVFPVTSVAIAIEFGRCIQPKITPAIVTYDQLKPDSPFTQAITIGQPTMEPHHAE